MRDRILAAICLSCLAAIFAVAQEPQPVLVVQTGQTHSLEHPGSFNSVALSSDGKWLVTGNRDKTARLWDVASGREIRAFHARGEVEGVVLSGDKRWLVTTGRFGAMLWDTATAKVLHPFEAGEFRRRFFIRSATLTSDGKRLVTDGPQPLLWDLKTGKDLREFEHKDATWAICAALSSDEKLVAAGWEGRRGATIWEFDTGKEVRTLKAPEEVAAVSFSRDGKYLVTGDVHGVARLWDVATGKELRVFPGHRNSIVSIAISGNGKWLVCASSFFRGGNVEQKHAVLWDLETGKKIREFDAQAVCFADDDKLLCCAGRDSVSLQDPLTGKETMVFLGQPEPVNCFALSADGRWLVTGSGSVLADWEVPGSHGAGHKTLTVWDLSLGKPVRSIKSPGESIAAVVVSNDGKWIASAGWHGNDGWSSTTRLWDLATGKEILSFAGGRSRTMCLALTHDDKKLATGHQPTSKFKGLVKLWDTSTGKELHSLETKQPRFTLRSLAMSRDGVWLLGGGSNSGFGGGHDAVLWEIDSGKEVRAFPGHWGFIDSLAISSDAKRIFVGSADGEARGAEGAMAWDLKAGKRLGAFAGHKDTVTCLALSADDKWLVTGSADRTARLWDAATTKAIRVFEGHTDELRSLALSPDGKRLFTLCADQTLRLWDVGTAKQLCRLVAFRDGTWAVVDPIGRYDGSDNGKVEGLHWVVGDRPIPLEKFAATAYESGLLVKHMGRNK